MTQEWIDYLKALSEWYAAETASVLAGTGAHTDTVGVPIKPPTPPGH